MAPLAPRLNCLQQQSCFLNDGSLRVQDTGSKERKIRYTNKQVKSNDDKT